MSTLANSISHTNCISFLLLHCMEPIVGAGEGALGGRDAGQGCFPSPQLLGFSRRGFGRITESRLARKIKLSMFTGGAGQALIRIGVGIGITHILWGRHRCKLWTLLCVTRVRDYGIAAQLSLCILVVPVSANLEHSRITQTRSRKTKRCYFPNLGKIINRRKDIFTLLPRLFIS